MIDIRISFLSDEQGASSIEYDLMAAQIAVGLIGAAEALKTNLSIAFHDIGEKLSNASDAGTGAGR